MMKRIYLDHAATTPLDDTVFQAMVPFMKEFYGNPSSMHQEGVIVKKAINTARSDVGARFGVSYQNVIFTSGGTEATNLAIRGIASKYPDRKEIITSKIEHHATLHTLDELEKKGYVVHRISVDQEGFLKMDELEKVISVNTLMVSLIWANNEIGTIQDIKKIGLLCLKYQVFFHVDAVQMVAHHKILMPDLPIDLLTCSAHKFYGPKGVGALIKKDYVTIDPILFGGKQEMGIRSGTEYVYGIIGFSKALELVQYDAIQMSNRLQALAQKLFFMIHNDCKEVILNGPKDFNKRIPGLLSLSFPGINSQEMAFALDQKGLSVSTGSACLSNEILESHVLKEIQVPKEVGTIRISLGKNNHEDDLEVIKNLIIETYQELSSEA